MSTLQVPGDLFHSKFVSGERRAEGIASRAATSGVLPIFRCRDEWWKMPFVPKTTS
jgi:hypothetical protein